MPDLETGHYTPSAWTDSNPEHVQAQAWLHQRMLAGIATTVDDIVAFDTQHGKTLLPWDDAQAGIIARRAAARRYLNRFERTVTSKLGNFQAKGFVNIKGAVDDETGKVLPHAYYSEPFVVETISPRAKVILDVTNRMASHAARLRAYHLTAAERQQVLDRIAHAMTGGDLN